MSDDLYPTIDENQAPFWKCRDCKHFKFVGPPDTISSRHGCTHRFDHAKMEYAHAYFVHVPEENGPICSDFEPKRIWPWHNWRGFEHWREWMRRQDVEDRTHTYERKNIAFQLKHNGKTDLTTYYYVAFDDYVYGSMFTEDGQLKAVYKKYEKALRTKEGVTIYPFVLANCDYVLLE